MKILILASNPRKDLNLDREIRDLKEVIKKSQNRQAFEVEDALAVKVGQLQELLFDHRPQIVHFCGHGSGQQGLVFEGNDGGEQWVRADALSDLFRLFSENVGCVLLNACYSEEQANAIVNHIDYVIGMNQEIRDDAAIAFSKGFYRALGYECSIEQAYEFGKNAIQLEISGSSKMRSVATEEIARKAEVVGAIAQVAIPEHLKPILKIKPNLAPSLRANITAPAQRLSQETQTAIQLEIDKSLGADTKAKQYRDRVREFLGDRKLSALEIIRLERLRKDLGLSETEANQILAEEQEPIRQSQDEYEAMLIGLIEAGHYPFNATTQEELQAARQELGLTDEEVAAIAPPILAAAEEDYQTRLVLEQQQEYVQNLQRYEQEFSRSIAAQYPIDSFVRDGLRKFQQSLELSDEDVAQIEQPLLAPKEAAYQRQQEEQRQREQQQGLARQQELKQQQRLEEQRKQEEAKRRPPLEQFEFQVPTVNVGSTTIEKPGLFGKKTETIITCNVSHQRGQADYFAEDLGGVTLEMIAIAGGTFTMGSPNHELERSSAESPQHSVTVQPFCMGKFAVTQAQWRAVAALSKVNVDLDPDPSYFKGADRPAEKVSWNEAVEFCDRLSQKTGKKYRLPSEAEWEYACRAGTTTPFNCGETIVTDLANYDGSYVYGSGTKGVCRRETKTIGSFPPNAFGLYEMHGNVWEWCADHWHETYEGAPKDGTAWVTGGDSDPRSLRGGSWSHDARNCRSAYRDPYLPDERSALIGFRVVCRAAWTL